MIRRVLLASTLSLGLGLCFQASAEGFGPVPQLPPNACPAPFTSSGSYVVPYGAHTLDLTVTASGSSGGNGATAATGTAQSGGAGGTGGNIVQQLGIPVNNSGLPGTVAPGTVLSITVNAGGAQPTGPGASGNPGLLSSVVGTGVSIIAQPGGAPSGGGTVASASGGSGGTRGAGGNASGVTGGTGGSFGGLTGVSGANGAAVQTSFGFAAPGSGSPVGVAGPVAASVPLFGASGAGQGGGVTSGAVFLAGGSAYIWNSSIFTYGGSTSGASGANATGTLYPNGGAGGAGGDATHAGGNGGLGYGPGAPGGGGGSTVTGAPTSNSDHGTAVSYGMGSPGNAGQVTACAHA